MPFTDSDAARVRKAAKRLIEEHHLPGMAIGVVSGDDLVFSEGFGYADIESKTPMTPEHRQRIGSITKTMVGLCAMALVEEGRLKLKDRVVSHLPDIVFHGAAESVTIRHLLTHTSGIGEFPNVKDMRREDFYLWSDSPDIPPVTELYPDGITVEARPGAKWAYCNHGYNLLGEIVSRAEEAPCHEVVRRRVFEPLGMVDTDLLDRPHAKLSTGYHREADEDMRELLARIGRTPPEEQTVDGHNIRGRFRYVLDPPAGAVQATIPDMARYACALLRRGGGIVRPETFDRMVAPQWVLDPRLDSWGLSFALQTFFGVRSIGHGGGVDGGWNTKLAVFPRKNTGVLVHANIAYHRFATVLMSIIAAALGVTPPTQRRDSTFDAAVLAGAPGVYEAPTPGPLTNFRVAGEYGRIQISGRDGGLVLHARRGPWKHGVRMLPTKDRDLLVLDTGEPEPPRVVALLDTPGNVAGLHFAHGMLWTMVKNPEIEPWA